MVVRQSTDQIHQNNITITPHRTKLRQFLRPHGEETSYCLPFLIIRSSIVARRYNVALAVMKNKAIYTDFIQTVNGDLQQSIMAVHGVVWWVGCPYITLQTFNIQESCIYMYG